MIKRIRILVVIMAVATTMLATGQAVELPVTVVDGKEYYYYDVQPKETIFTLSQRLGMSREAIIDANPAVADGLKAYTRLYFPVDKGKVEISPATVGDQALNHTVEKGETLYGISKRYGVTVDRLIELNPQARDGVKSGQVIVVSREIKSSDNPVVGADLSKTDLYVIKDGETLYRIASDHGITVDNLLSANPGLDAFNYSSGTEIKIPQAIRMADGVRNSSAADGASVSVTEPVKASAEAVAEDDMQSSPVGNGDEGPSVAAVSSGLSREAAVSGRTAAESGKEMNDSGDLNIAVMLPFMLAAESPSKPAMLFTDFYKGFLLAADTLSHAGKRINVYAYDTASSLDTVKVLMARPEMSRMDLIIAPENDEQLDYIVSTADDENTFILNSFAVKNDSYKDNANVIQTNIPHQQMYQKAISAFIAEFGDRHPVFVSRIGGAADKDEFVALMKSALADRGTEFTEVVFREVLSDEDLSGLDPEKSYVFIPVSGSRSEFIKIVPALKRYNETMAGAEGIAMFGFPEWVTFRGDMQENLSRLNAVVYSRFYNDENYYPSRRVAEKFRSCYGRDMISSAPSQGMLGYDTGCYVIKAMRKNDGDFHLSPFAYDGLQSSFVMEDNDVDGLVNTSLLLLKFKPDGLVERIKL